MRNFMYLMLIFLMIDKMIWLIYFMIYGRTALIMFSPLMLYKYNLANYNVKKMCKSREHNSTMRRIDYKYYAILGCDQNMDYLFLLPITVLTWKKIQVESLVFLAGEYEDYIRYPDKRYIVETLVQIGAHITYVDSKKLSWTTIAQTSRLYAAGFPIADVLDPDKSIFITADADMFTFDLSPHLPDFSKGENIRTYPPDCCPPIPTPKGDRKVKHFAINTIAMSVGTWRELLGMNRSSIRSGDDLARKLYEDLGEDYFANLPVMASPLWFADQRIISYRFEQWVKKSARNKAGFSEYSKNPNRLDFQLTNIWHKINFADLDITQYDDATLPRGNMQEEYTWERFYEFIKAIFCDDLFIADFIETYKKNLGKISSSMLDVKPLFS